MPRIRTVKPDFWSDSKMVRLSPYARLFFIGMWNFALCDKGHLPDDPDELKLKILPADPVDPDELIEELIKLDRVRRMVTRGGETFLWAVRLDKHQKVDPRWNSRCPYCAETDAAPVPPPETHSNSRGTHRVSPELPGVYVSAGEPGLTETPRSVGETRLVVGSKGREGKGREVPPAADALTLVRDEQPATTDALIAEWLDHCRKRPPGNVIGQVGKQVKAMLAEGIDPPDVRAGLAAWWRKGLHPSALPSVVNELMNASPTRASPAGLIERDGMQLKPETAARLDDRQRWRDRDAAGQRLALGGTAS